MYGQRVNLKLFYTAFIIQAFNSRPIQCGNFWLSKSTFEVGFEGDESSQSAYRTDVALGLTLFPPKVNFQSSFGSSFDSCLYKNTLRERHNSTVMSDRTHRKEYLFVCKLCTKLYKSEGSLSVHVRMKHSKNYHRSGEYTPLHDENNGVNEQLTTDATASDAVSQSEAADNTALEKVMNAIGDGAGNIVDQFLETAAGPAVTAVSPAPPQPPPLQLPFGFSTTTVAEWAYRNRHLTPHQLRRLVETTCNAGLPLIPADASLLEGAFEVAAAAERRLASAIQAVQDAASGAPELISQTPEWTAALIRAALNRPL